jgi:hypothetical protein
MGKSIKIGISILFILYLSCNSPTQPPPPGNGLLTLSLTDVSCTEAWIELKTNGVALPVNVSLLANNSLITQINNLNHSDTTIYVDSLLPNKSYQLQAQISQSILVTSSNKLAVQTLDTTSNNFTWQTFTFGDPNGGSCSLNDVAVIDANDIWAVGEIFMDDSTGQPDPLQYNAIHWNGNNWTVIRIPYYYQGQPYYNPIQTVFAFSSNDIWFAGNGVLHWDGNQYNPVPLPSNVWGQDQINKIWGSSDNDLYIVGNSGSIAHYNGTTWQKIESGTQYPSTDVWGISNMGSVSKVIAVAYPPGPGESTIFSLISGSAIDTLDLPGERFGSIWTYGMKTYAGGLKTWVSTNNNWKQALDNGYRIRGSQYNNIIGALINKIVHFNGTRWQNIVGVPSEFSTNGVSTKDNIVVVVGSIVNGGVVGQAAIVVGTY